MTLRGCKQYCLPGVQIWLSIFPGIRENSIKLPDGKVELSDKKYDIEKCRIMKGMRSIDFLAMAPPIEWQSLILPFLLISWCLDHRVQTFHSKIFRNYMGDTSGFLESTLRIQRSMQQRHLKFSICEHYGADLHKLS